MKTPVRSMPHVAALSEFVLLIAVSTFIPQAQAQRTERQGKDVVDAVCGACHLQGKDNAPRIGDARAWSARASKGLTALTDNALKGIRNMPAHGGNAGVSDIEIERAIIRLIMRMTGGPTRPDTVVEYTDWKRVEAFGRALCADLALPRGAAAVPSTFRGEGALRA